MSQTDYFDSSALVKRYLAESGSTWVIARYQDAARIIATADFSRVEIAAAFAANSTAIPTGLLMDARSPTSRSAIRTRISSSWT